MCRLLESIRIFNGKADNLDEHQARVTRSQQALFNKLTLSPLADLLEQHPPPSTGLYKWRILYDKNLIDMSYSLYTRKVINQLSIVHLPDATYPHKFAERGFLTNANKSVAKDCEALIVVNGFVTDTTFTNVAFFDGSSWLTPENPLLPGTRRANLLKKNILRTAPIRQEKIKTFIKIRLFNAMLTWDEAIELPTTSIR